LVASHKEGFLLDADDRGSRRGCRVGEELNATGVLEYAIHPAQEATLGEDRAIDADAIARATVEPQRVGAGEVACDYPGELGVIGKRRVRREQPGALPQCGHLCAEQLVGAA
jgi:predicted nuclease with RNAse H fold